MMGGDSYRESRVRLTQAVSALQLAVANHDTAIRRHDETAAAQLAAAEAARAGDQTWADALRSHCLLGLFLLPAAALASFSAMSK